MSYDIDFEFENNYIQNGNYNPLFFYNEYCNLNIDNNSFYNQDKNDNNRGLDKNTQANTNEEKIFQIQNKDEIKQSINVENSEQKNQDININIEYSKEIKNKNKYNKKKCGRKRNKPDTDDNHEEHNKFSDDNMRRKCKHLVLNNSLKFINFQIDKIYNGNIGVGVFKKELKIVSQSQKFDATVTFNYHFLNKKLGDIFSEDISGRYTNLPSNHNKLVIYNLMNEKDENKKQYFNKLFNITFIQCMKHFINQDSIKELEGMKCFNDVKNDILNKCPKDGKEYIESLEYYLKNYEVIINNKKARKSNKQKIINMI